MDEKHSVNINHVSFSGAKTTSGSSHEHFSALSKKSECEEHLNTPRHYHAVLCGYSAT